MERAFPDIEELASQCKFRNCTHTNEPRCAIQNALEMGKRNCQVDQKNADQTVKK